MVSVLLFMALACELCSTGERPIPAWSAHAHMRILNHLIPRGQQQLLSHRETRGCSAADTYTVSFLSIHACVREDW